jgi:hypothetical protein
MRQNLRFLICFLLVSCANPKKLHRMMDDLPEASAKECSERYPIKEKTDTVSVVDSVLINAYENELFLLWKQLDSVLSVGCDTVVIDRIKQVIRKIPDKPQIKYIIKTQESTAKLQVLKNDCDKTIKSLSQINSQSLTKIHELELNNGKLKARNNWMWLLIVCLTAFSFRRQISKLIA